MQKLIHRIVGAERPRITILGDIMLDTYVEGEARRLCPDAPCPVLSNLSRTNKPGGAGNLAVCLAALGADVTLAGGVGADAEGRLLLHLLHQQGIITRHIAMAGETTVKESVFARSSHASFQKIARLDRDVRWTPDAAYEAACIAACAGADMVLIQDHGKGAAIPVPAGPRVILDPCMGTQLPLFDLAETIVPNRHELDDIKRRDVLENADQRHVVAKMDREGCFVDGQRIEGHARAVADVTGAGDVFLAWLARGLCAGLSLLDAARCANLAAGLSVEKRYTATITMAEALAAVGPTGEGRRTVWVNGCFDLLHDGHVRFLEEAAARGDFLIVGLDTDARVSASKGDGRPVNPYPVRETLLRALRCVGDVVPLIGDPMGTIEQIRPDVVVRGWDQRHDDIPAGPDRVILPRYGDGSTSARLAALRSSVQAQPPSAATAFAP